MSVSDSQCQMMYKQWLTLSKTLQAKSVGFAKESSLVQTATDLLTDNVLDTASSNLTGLNTPNGIDTSSMTDGLTETLEACPALVYVIPTDIISKVNSGLTFSLPTVLLNKLTKSIKGKISDLMSGALDGNTFSTFDKIKVYDKRLTKANIPSLMQQLSYLETCLQGNCSSSVPAFTPIHDTLKTNMKLNSSYMTDMTTLASDAGLDLGKLTDTYTQFTNKLDI